MYAPPGDETKATAGDVSKVQLAIMPDSLNDTLSPGAAVAKEVPGQGHRVLDPRPAEGQVGDEAPGLQGGEGEAEGQGPQPGQDRAAHRRPAGQDRPAGAELGPMYGPGSGHLYYALDLDTYIMQWI